MNNWKPNYRTRPGVEVMAHVGQDGGYREVRTRGAGTGLLCNLAEFAALFEPIPKPKMVEIPLGVATALRDILKRGDIFDVTFDAAILAAEQEQTT
jgi:hypothetical protein